jgi:predicted RecB family nuclease
LLDAFGPPACYLDFEAMMPPIPLYEGTRPYQTIPFQWSLHTIDGDGMLNHKEFLADGVNDPRRQFAETLVDTLAWSDDPIIVYSAYEHTRLKELAADFFDLSKALNALIARLADLLPIVRSAIYFPEFGYNNSIKSVSPALCPGFSYDDLDGVADGAAASGAFLQLASGALTVLNEAADLRTQLLAYCKRDTLAMVEVHKALLRLTVK